jgi:energy-coupling factor transporter ATP-binding protein EcfA2
VNAMLTHLPQPLVLIQGPAGTGKTTSLRLLLDLIDPTSSMAGGSLTDDERTVRALSKVRRVMVFDNVSYVKGDASDLLAKITTGSELITRALYQNSAPDVVQLKRPVILNGIIDGFSRSDLASRTVAFNLQPVAKGDRISEPVLLDAWQRDLPLIFRGLLDMASTVIAKLPNTPAAETNFRNVDLVKITSIVGDELGIEGLTHLEHSVAELSASVLGASAMGQAFTSLVVCWRDGKCRHELYGEGSLESIFDKALEIDVIREALLKHIDISEHRSIPALNKGFGEALKRIESDLASVLGLTLIKGRNENHVTYKLEVN